MNVMSAPTNTLSTTDHYINVNICKLHKIKKKVIKNTLFLPLLSSFFIFIATQSQCYDRAVLFRIIVKDTYLFVVNLD